MPSPHLTPPSRRFGPAPSTSNPSQASRNPFVIAPKRLPFTRPMGPALNDDQVLVEEPSSNQKAPIPSAFEQEEYATPLPVLSMIVLSITMLGEFLSANVSTPFILFMVRGFGELADEAQVAFWTGIIVSSFFLTQFLTSLLWATVAEKYGRRLVLLLSLAGSAVACFMFGTATTIRQAISIRLLQGVFAGAVGVARGSVGFMTDSTNEGRAYAILGFCWGLGGVAGAIVGGAFERPADKWPGVFGHLTLFVNYPYLLPCAVAALITGSGAFLSLFLNREGGPREGAIKLPPEKGDVRIPSPIPEENESVHSSVHNGEGDQHPKTFAGALRTKISGPLQAKLSGYFSKSPPSEMNAPSSVPTPTIPEQSPVLPVNNSARFAGSAYGYTGRYRNQSFSSAGFSLRRSSLNNSIRRRRGNSYDQEGPSSLGEMNFAQRLLMANENAVTNIADLWVASALNADNDDRFDSALETEDEDDLLSLEDGETGVNDEAASLMRPSLRSSVTRGRSRSIVNGRPRIMSSSTMIRPHSPTPSRQGSFSSTMPSIFAHSGVKTPTAVLDAQSILETQTLQQDRTLEPIPEAGRTDIEQGVVAPELQPSLWSVVPVMIVFQYGLLALHATTHDQIFVSYLVTDYKAGGLNLNAGHFAQLIALMSLAQIAYQFYLYPNIGPPRGRFSHLAMFRIGSLLFIPSYLTVVLYRPFASAEDDGNIIVMIGLAVSTAVRYCGMTFAYTSISILLNYMTPPHAVGIANGIAQSIISLARFFGPILGGWLWSVSVEDNPSGYPFGFVVCSAACGLAVALTLLIR